MHYHVRAAEAVTVPSLMNMTSIVSEAESLGFRGGIACNGHTHARARTHAKSHTHARTHAHTHTHTHTCRTDRFGLVYRKLCFKVALKARMKTLTATLKAKTDEDVYGDFESKNEDAYGDFQ